MSEWLTTGAMIDRLKIGEIAKTDTDDRAYWDGTGTLTLKSTNGNRYDFLPIELKKVKWRILPKYVSFEEAMEALKKGKKVELHRNAFPEITVFRHWYKLENRQDLSFSDLFNGKWTIIEGEAD